MADFYLVSRALGPEKAYAPRACHVLRWLHHEIRGRVLQYVVRHEFALVTVHPPIPKEVYDTEHDLTELMLQASARGASLRDIGEHPVYVTICRLTFQDEPIPDDVDGNWRVLDWGLVYRTEEAASVQRRTRLRPGEVDELLKLHEVWLTSIGEHGQQLWLEYADLSGINLAGRDLYDSVLPGVNLDGANLADANLAAAHLHGASLRHADLHRANLAKANLAKVQADHSLLVEANLLRCELDDADLRGASLDRAVLIKTAMSRADLRGCTLRSAKLERVWLRDAVLGPIDATGATGSIMAGTTIWETNGQRQVLDVDQLIAALWEAGAGDIIAVAPQ